MREPVARFGMDVNFGNVRARLIRIVQAQDHVAIHRTRVVAELFLHREIPVRVKPVRIARRQEQSPRAVRSRGAALGFIEMIQRRSRAERELFSRAAEGWLGSSPSTKCGQGKFPLCERFCGQPSGTAF